MKTLSPASLRRSLDLWSSISPTTSIECLHLWLTVAEIESSRNLDLAPLSVAELAGLLPRTSVNSVHRFVQILSVRKGPEGLEGASLLRRDFSPLLGSREHALSVGKDGRKLLDEMMGTGDIEPLYKG